MDHHAFRVLFSVLESEYNLVEGCYGDFAALVTEHWLFEAIDKFQLVIRVVVADVCHVNVTLFRIWSRPDGNILPVAVSYAFQSACQPDPQVLVYQIHNGRISAVVVRPEEPGICNAGC